jgi:hypothetical protein
MTGEKQTLEKHQISSRPAPLPVSEEDVEKGDVVIDTPPPRRRGTIQVRLKYGGRRKPIPVDFPDDGLADGVGCAKGGCQMAISIEGVLERAFEQAFLKALEQTVQTKAEELFRKALSPGSPLSQKLQEKMEQGFQHFLDKGD